MIHYIEHSNIAFSDQVFLSYKNNEITFSEFYENVSSHSRAITSLNLNNHSIVGIFLSNPIDIINTYFSCIQLNKKPIIFPTDITDYQLQQIIDTHKIDFVISEWLRKKQVSLMNNCNFFYIQEISSSYGGCGSIDFDSNIGNMYNTQSLHLTSGSTGIPKMIPLSFLNFLHYFIR